MDTMVVDTHSLSRHSMKKQSKISKLHVFKAKGGRCQRLGPVGRNPYLNFLREFRKRNGNLSPVETVRRGAQEWKALPKEQKLQYIEAAFYAPRKRRPPPRPQILRVTSDRMHSSGMDNVCCPKVKCGPSKKKQQHKKKKKMGGCKAKSKSKRKSGKKSSKSSKGGKKHKSKAKAKGKAKGKGKSAGKSAFRC